MTNCQHLPLRTEAIFFFLVFYYKEMRPFSHYENRQKFSTFAVFRALPSDVDEETQVQSAEENILSKPETEKTADEADLSQPANQGDPQPQEVIVTPAEAEPLLRKATSSANLEIASGVTPFQIELMKVTQADQCKEKDKSDIEMTTLKSADTHSTNSS